MTWDPSSQQWVPASTQQSNATAAGYGDPTESNVLGGGPATEGQVQAWNGKSTSGGAWGGYMGTNVRNPDGTISLDTSLNGTTADVNRMQGLATVAAHNQAFQNDNTQTNTDLSLGSDDRRSQAGAASLARGMAQNGNAQTNALGQNMLQQGLQSQQALAASTRGGSLAQAAAMHGAQNGAGAFMQQGNAALAAQRANDMATGRNMYMDQTTAMRAGDATAQGINQNKAISQMNNELGQRQLNQAGQVGYEQMGQNVDNASQNAALSLHEQDVGIDATASLRAQKQADRDQQSLGAAAGTAGAFAASIGKSDNAPSPPPQEQQAYSDNPDVTGSDERMKQNVRGLAAVAALRGRY
jgi:hypothetical protein